MSAEALPLVHRLGIKPKAWIATMQEAAACWDQHSAAQKHVAAGR
jgi:hypothetical protein